MLPLRVLGLRGGLVNRLVIVVVEAAKDTANATATSGESSVEWMASSL